jgi:hypothetical protein
MCVGWVDECSGLAYKIIRFFLDKVAATTSEGNVSALRFRSVTDGVAPAVVVNTRCPTGFLKIPAVLKPLVQGLSTTVKCVLRLFVLRLFVLRLFVLRLFVLRLFVLRLFVLRLCVLRLFVLRLFVLRLFVLRLFVCSLFVAAGVRPSFVCPSFVCLLVIRRRWKECLDVDDVVHAWPRARAGGGGGWARSPAVVDLAAPW